MKNSKSDPGSVVGGGEKKGVNLYKFTRRRDGVVCGCGFSNFAPAVHTYTRYIIRIRIRIYVCACVCVCVRARVRVRRFHKNTSVARRAYFTRALKLNSNTKLKTK